MQIGDVVNYFGKDAEVIYFDKTHVLIKFKSGTIICTDKLTFK